MLHCDKDPIWTKIFVMLLLYGLNPHPLRNADDHSVDWKH